MLTIQGERYAVEDFSCRRCKHDFRAVVATWVDVTGTPRVRGLLQRGEFNLVTCPHCGFRQFSASPFFYEDFAEGLLVAVFPVIPPNHEALQKEITATFGYYPLLEFFYDMTQLWLLIYLQEHYRNVSNTGKILDPGGDGKRLRTFLTFVKTDPLMLAVREALTETFNGTGSSDDLQDVLWRALVKLEDLAPSRQRKRLFRG